MQQRHKGLLWGVYVDPQWRGHSLGQRLTQAVIDHARLHVDTVHATVMAANISARTLYLGLGFTVYGFEKDALAANPMTTNCCGSICTDKNPAEKLHEP
nr:GNAT family N-acetyltransferase [Phyllobacterium sp. 2063]